MPYSREREREFLTPLAMREKNENRKKGKERGKWKKPLTH